MKILLISCLLSIGAIANAQEVTYEQWEQEARINKRLIPKYNYYHRSADEIEADDAFKQKLIDEHKSPKTASTQLVHKGINILAKDPKMAMSHFNQAFILDSSNSIIYYGYGKLYSHFNQNELARDYYNQGLSADPKNFMLMTAMGESYKVDYHSSGDMIHLDQAISFFKKSFMTYPQNSKLCYELAAAYIEKQDCDNAKTYYKAYLANIKEGDGFELMEKFNLSCE